MNSIIITRRLVSRGAVIFGVAIVSVLFLGLAQSAHAGVGIGVAPTIPSPVTVGDTEVPASLNITNTSSAGEVIDLTSIRMTPQCGDFSAPCSNGDPGVFAVSATGAGANACSGINFSIAEVNAATGQVELTPDATVTLNVGQTCEIDFTVDVLQAPTKDAQGGVDGLQTAQTAQVEAIENGGTLPGSGTGSSVTTVLDPSTDVSASVDVAAIISGDEVTLTITETNDGNSDLSNPFVDLQPLGMTLDENSAEFTGGDIGNDGVLGAGETWTWEVTDTPASDTTYVAIGHGTTLAGDDLTWCEDPENPPEGVLCDQDERDEATVTVSNPSIEIIKTGDELSKVGDDVTYSFTINNNGDTELFLESISDDVLGDISTEASAAGCDTLASNASCNFSVDYTVQESDSDPLENTVTVTYDTAESLDGFDVSDTDTHSLNLFQPSVSVTKTGPAEAGTGDTITYDYTIENTSSNDSPDLILDSVIDDVIGDLTTDATNAGCDTLASGEDCNFTADYTVQEDDPNPLVNTVDVLYNPEGFQNEITDSDDHSVEITGFAGCTPGFWKNQTHLWTDPYDPDDAFSEYFEDAFGVMTLLEVAQQGGGGLKALGRHVVAALLNAAHPDVEYPMSEHEVIDEFNDVHPGSKSDYNALKNELEGFNEEGCSIDAHGNPENGEEEVEEPEEEEIEVSGRERAEIARGGSQNRGNGRN